MGGVEERLRFASLRGKIITKIEEIMDQASWDEESCQKVRSLIDPMKHSTDGSEQDLHDIWTETVRQTIKLFENLFRSQNPRIVDKEIKEKNDEEFVIEPE